MHFPPAGDWPRALERYNHDRALYFCPSDEREDIPLFGGEPVSYTMNELLGGVCQEDLKKPGAVPLFFDGTRPVGGPGEAAFRHPDGATCVYADATSKWVAEDQWEASWRTPRIRPPARGDALPGGGGDDGP